MYNFIILYFAHKVFRVLLNSSNYVSDFKKVFISGLATAVDLPGAGVNIFINEYKNQDKIYTLGLYGMENTDILQPGTSNYVRIGAFLGITAGVGLILLSDNVIWILTGASDLVYNLVDNCREKKLTQHLF